MPAGASVVQPVTEAEQDAFRAFMTWVAESLSIGEQNAVRAEAAKAACGS